MDYQETVSYWDARAESSARERAGVLDGEGYSRWEAALLEILPKADGPLRVLDAGSGAGFLSVILSGMGHAPIGVDVSPAMVQFAYETAAARGRRIEFRIMDCAKMDFESESFDAIVCCELVPHLRDARQAWAEFKRVLKKDGRIIIFDSGEANASVLLAQGFSHCRAPEFGGLTALKDGGSLHCLTARRPSRGENEIIPQISLFNHHIQTAKKQIQLYQNWCQSIGIPYSEYMVLNMISRHAKGARPSDISNALIIPPQTLTRILAALQSEGYIERKVSERDQRSAVITITEAGLVKIRPHQAALREIEESALFGFGVDELSGLRGTSDKILNSLEEAFNARN